MSFLSGAECSAAANPLTQFTKHTQDEKSFQRDRLAGTPSKAMQSIRSVNSVDIVGVHDKMIDDFRAQTNQIIPETYSMSYGSQQEKYAQMGPLSATLNGWVQDFTRGSDIQSQMEAAYHTHETMSFKISDYSQIEQITENAAQTINTVGHPLEANLLLEQNCELGMRMAMGFGVGGVGMGYMPRKQFQPQYRLEQIDNGKGKAKMIELDDENWEEQFKQIDLEGQEQATQQERFVEADLDQVDKSILEPERTDFADFESIWRGIKAESSAERDSVAKGQLADNSDKFENWGDLGGMDIPFQNPQLGVYMFEEDNLFKEIANPFEEGVRIVEEGGNLSLAALAFEMAVQREPNHINAWVMLGSAQAQNEKETPAIRALEQALKLDPANLTALMGLAVSYTNEGYDSMAYNTLERWLSFKYPSLADPINPILSSSEVGFTDRFVLHEKVIDLFIRAAQLSPDGEHMDPDVQVGLGVLFYGAEEYDKAVDCFSAALSSTENGASNRKDQLHLLWNRLGATLANSGRSEEAIAAYEEALTLRPNFVRARYNLGVSCINIGCYNEAASHLLGALSMHKVVENEGRQKAKDILNKSGVGGSGSSVGESELENIISQNQSNNLYDTLRRVFNQMGRRDLVERVDVDMDVESFRSDFDF